MAVAQDDALGSPHAHLGWAYTLKGEYDKALAEGERAIALDPNGADCHAFYARSLDRAGRPQEAIPMFQKAIRLNPYCPAHYYQNFGNALRNAGRFEEAVSAYKKAIPLAPDNIWTHFGLAVTYTLAGRPQEAIPFYQKAIQLNPSGQFYFYTNFGNALRDAGRFEEAVSAYKEAFRLAPDNLPTRLALTVTYTMMGSEKEARAEAEEVLRINSKFLLDSFAKTLRYKDQSQNDKIVNALSKAGLK